MSLRVEGEGYFIFRIDISAMSKEESGNSLIAIADGQSKSGLSAFVGGIDANIGNFEHHFNFTVVAFFNSKHEEVVTVGRFNLGVEMREGKSEYLLAEVLVEFILHVLESFFKFEDKYMLVEFLRFGTKTFFVLFNE